MYIQLFTKQTKSKLSSKVKRHWRYRLQTLILHLNSKPRANMTFGNAIYPFILLITVPCLIIVLFSIFLKVIGTLVCQPVFRQNGGQNS